MKSCYGPSMSEDTRKSAINDALQKMQAAFDGADYPTQDAIASRVVAKLNEVVRFSEAKSMIDYSPEMLERLQDEYSRDAAVEELFETLY